MVVSLAVVAVLIGGMGSAVVLASRALPHAQNPAAVTVASAEALHQLRDDLRAATQLLNRTASSVTINLPDRDGDGRPEVITYAWAGTPGDPLTRAVNGSVARPVLGRVASLVLAYDTVPQTTILPGPPNPPSEEQLFSLYEAEWPGSHNLKATDWIGIEIAPDLPREAMRWRITRAHFSGAVQGGTGSVASFELRRWVGAEPGDTVIERVEVAESALDRSFAWREVRFDADVTFDAAQTAALVLANHGGGDAGKWQYDDVGPSPRTAYFTVDQAATWEPDDGDDNDHLLHYVYGSYDTVGEDWSYTLDRIAAVDITLAHADRPATTQRLRVPLANAPDAADALLLTDLAADPRTLDLDADGVADWEVKDDASPGEITGGVIALEQQIMRVGLEAELNRPFVLELRLQDDTDDGNPAKLEVKYDLDDGIAAKFKLYVDRDGSGQTVTLYTHDPDHDDIELHTVTVEAGDMIDVRLFVDPDRDTLAIAVDDQAAQSYRYLRSHNDHTGEIKLKPDGGGSSILLDHVRVRIGGQTAVVLK
jgi:hypothetical protein